MWRGSCADAAAAAAAAADAVAAAAAAAHWRPGFLSSPATSVGPPPRSEGRGQEDGDLRPTSVLHPAAPAAPRLFSRPPQRSVGTRWLLPDWLCLGRRGCPSAPCRIRTKGDIGATSGIPQRSVKARWPLCCGGFRKRWGHFWHFGNSQHVASPRPCYAEAIPPLCVSHISSAI